MSKAMYFEPS
jgi:hypothetical protein